MGAQCVIVQCLVMVVVGSATMERAVAQTEEPKLFSPFKEVQHHRMEVITERSKSSVFDLSTLASDINSTFSAISTTSNSFEGRMRKKKYKRQELMMLTKMLMGLKIALLGVVLPLGVVAAKVLSWKAVTLSLLAFMLAKIVFVKNLFMGKSSTSPSTPALPPPAPIIIHSSPPDTWKRHSNPKIHLQPEVHVHQAGEEHHPTPPWSWADESRAMSDPHVMAFGAWLPKKS